MFVTPQGTHSITVGCCGAILCSQWEKMDQLIWKSELFVSRSFIVVKVVHLVNWLCVGFNNLCLIEEADIFLLTTESRMVL